MTSQLSGVYCAYSESDLKMKNNVYLGAGYALCASRI